MSAQRCNAHAGQLRARMGRWAALLPLGCLLGAGVVHAAFGLAAELNESALWPAPRTVLTLPADTDAFVERLLASLSLEEKVGQMIQADIASITPQDLDRYPLGSILAGGGAAPGNDVRTSPQAWLDLTRAFLRASLRRPSAADARAAHVPIPILFGIDAVHGDAKIIGATVFPHNIALGATHDVDLMRRIGAATAEEVAATGVNWTFAPTVAVARDVRWGRSYESYAEDPALVAQYAAAMVSGLQGERGSAQFMAPGHTLSSVKHFVGDGGTVDGRDQGNDVLPESTLRTVHAAAYPAAIDAGAMIVMASFNSWNGTKMHANHYLLTDILKGRLGFQGFVVGDWNAQEQIPGCTKFSCPAAIFAGVDMLMAPDSWQPLFRNTLAQVRAGTIPLERIDDAVRRILRVKALAGLFALTPDAVARAGGQFERLGSAAHRALAREAVRKSLVLLKNEHALLPLPAAQHVLVAGAAADEIGTQAGGWTVDWQGDHNSNADFPGATSIFAGIAAAVEAAGGSASYSPEGDYAARPDVAIVVFGERPYAEFEGDRETLDYSAEDQHSLALLRRLHAAGIAVVSVFLSGRPMWVNPELNASDAFVAAWLPGSEGAGIADVLFRATDGSVRHAFSGRLSFSWPRTAMPVRFDAAGNASGALFARGYGLDDTRATHVAHLSEDPQLPPQRRTPDTLFHDAHVTAPWSIYLTDPIAEVRLTTASQLSPQGNLVAALNATGLSLRWRGAGAPDGGGALFRIAGRPADWRGQAAVGMQLKLRWRLDAAPSGRVLFGVRCAAPYSAHPQSALSAPPLTDAALCGVAGGAMLDLTPALQRARVGAWHTLSYPLSCFTARGADLSNLETPLAIASTGPLALSIAEVRLAPATGAAARGECDGS